MKCRRMTVGCKTLLPGFESDVMRKTILLTGCLAVFLPVFASSMMNIALPSIMERFGLNEAVAAWAVASYSLCYALPMPMAGALSDHWERRKVYIAGMTLFLLATTVGALSSSFALLILARCLQGSGAAAMFPAAVTMIREVLTSSTGRAMGFVSAGASVGMLLGSPVCGYLLEVGDYRAIFLAILPAVGLLCIVGGFAVSSHPVFRCSNSLRELSTALPYYKVPAYITVIVLTSCQYFIFSSLSITFPLILIRTFELSPSQTSNLLLVFPLTFLIVSPLGGHWADKSGYQVPAAFGSLFLVVSLFFSSVMSVHTVISVTALNAALGVAFGLSASPLSVGSMKHASEQDIAKASGLFGFFRQSSGSAGAMITPLIENSNQIFGFLAALLLLGLILFVAINQVELFPHISKRNTTQL